MEKEKIVYVWDTSIPERWKRIMGPEGFVHISKSSRAKNTLEFMVETQKYIHQIRNYVSGSNLKSNKPKMILKKRLSNCKPHILHKDSVSKNLNIDQNDTSKFFLNYSRKNSSDVLFPSNSPKSQISKNNSVLHFHRKSEKSLQSPKYAKSKNKQLLDYICLPKALQASSNRVVNYFSPRNVQSNSINNSLILLK